MSKVGGGIIVSGIWSASGKLRDPSGGGSVVGCNGCLYGMVVVVGSVIINDHVSIPSVIGRMSGCTDTACSRVHPNWFRSANSSAKFMSVFPACPFL